MLQFEYPRPQLVRDAWQSLNGTWDFAYDDARQYRHPGDNIAWTHEITVPYAPVARASGLGDTGFHTVCWYRRSFVVEQPAPRTMLHFGAVDYRARVWVNGMLVAEHEGGHTPFSADITDALIEDGPQTLVVRAEDDPADLAPPASGRRCGWSHCPPPTFKRCAGRRCSTVSKSAATWWRVARCATTSR
jgi:beta-galactosidase/beta-glucuronidase